MRCFSLSFVGVEASSAVDVTADVDATAAPTTAPAAAVLSPLFGDNGSDDDACDDEYEMSICDELSSPARDGDVPLASTLRRVECFLQ